MWECPNVGSSCCLQQVSDAGTVGKALGKTIGGRWEEKSDTGIPGNVNLKGVSGKGAHGMDRQPCQDHGGTQPSRKGTFQPGCRELQERPSERAVTTVPALGAAPESELIPGRQ